MHPLPPPVERLLSSDEPSREDAWRAFVAEYSRLILHVARSQAESYDEAMDRYAHVLEQLRAEDLRRLRAYVSDGRGKFTTWLVVVVRRLCIDLVRQRYGRDRDGRDGLQARRALADLVGSDVDLGLLPDDSGPGPAEALRSRELRDALSAGLDLLDPSDRLLLRLRFQDAVPVAEIARILALPTVFHVYRRLNRILGELRTRLEELGVEDASP